MKNRIRCECCTFWKCKIKHTIGYCAYYGLNKAADNVCVSHFESKGIFHRNRSLIQTTSKSRDEIIKWK